MLVSLTICAYHPPTALRNFLAIGKDNGAFVSTTNGGFASYGIAATLLALKFVTTTDRRRRQWKDCLTSTPAKFKEALADADETLFVEWTHRHYVQDDEYIPHDEDIEAFLKREIAKPIIRWEETKKDGKTILGYEILPNKYFYRYQPPTPAKELLAEFWRLEGLAR